MFPKATLTLLPKKIAPYEKTLFALLKNQAEKYCSLIYCEKKTLYHG